MCELSSYCFSIFSLFFPRLKWRNIGISYFSPSPDLEDRGKGLWSNVHLRTSSHLHLWLGPAWVHTPGSTFVLFTGHRLLTEPGVNRSFWFMSATNPRSEVARGITKGCGCNSSQACFMSRFQLSQIKPGAALWAFHSVKTWQLFVSCPLYIYKIFLWLYFELCPHSKVKKTTVVSLAVLHRIMIWFMK